MQRNNNILLRVSTSKEWLLCHPIDNHIEKINATGAFIWEQLANEISLDELKKRLLAHYEGVTEQTLETDLRNFLGMLKYNGYILRYDGEACAPPLGSMKLPEGYHPYKGLSMKRVFVPGDTLKSEEIDFDEIQAGDIIAFPTQSGKKNLVHRVIRRCPEGLITKGDNNPRRDYGFVTRDIHPRIIVARILPDGTELPVTRGKEGIRQFRINRLKRVFNIFDYLRRILNL